MSVIPAFRKLGLEICNFKASLGHPVSKKKMVFVCVQCMKKKCVTYLYVMTCYNTVDVQKFPFSSNAIIVPPATSPYPPPPEVLSFLIVCFSLIFRSDEYIVLVCF